MSRAIVLLALAVFPSLFASVKLADIPAGGISVLADPLTRTYYLYAIGQADKQLTVYTSKDLASWDGPQPVFEAPEGHQGIRDARVVAYRGKYYLFATLLNRDNVISKPPQSWRVLSAQGTRIFVSETPHGPFTGAASKSYTPLDVVALDGTLFVDGDQAWLVYAHDWTQLIDANIEAVRLKADLSAPVDDPIYLFKASDAPWHLQQKATSREPRYYPAHAPLPFRTKTGSLVMIWSGMKDGKPAVTTARSLTGRMRGPWEPGNTLLADGTSVAAVFRGFDGRILMVGRLRDSARLIELDEAGETVRIKTAKKGSAR